MNLILNNKDRIEILILDIVLVQSFILNFLGLSKVGNWILFLLIILFLVLYLTYNKRKRCVILMLIGITPIYFAAIISALTGAFFNISIFRSNINSITYPLFLVVFFALFSFFEPERFREYFQSRFWLFNGYFIINIIVLLIQVHHPGFLAGRSTWVNTYNQDLMSGLFGYSGTHQLALYSCFIIIYNLYMRKILAKYKKILLFYIMALGIFILAISSMNDNKMQYILLINILLCYFFASNYNPDNNWERMKTILEVLILMGIIVFIIFMLYHKITFVHELLDRTVVSIINKMQDINSQRQNVIEGGAERIYLILFAFSKFRGWTTGYGIGTYWWQEPGALGFVHFGQADLGTFLCLGGVFFVVPLFVVYYVLYLRMAKLYKTKHTFFLKLFIFVFHLIVAVYTTPMKNTTMQIGCLLCMAVLGLTMESKLKNGKRMNRS